MTCPQSVAHDDDVDISLQVANVGPVSSAAGESCIDVQVLDILPHVENDMKRVESSTRGGAELTAIDVVDRDVRNRTVEELVSPGPVKTCSD